MLAGTRNNPFLQDFTPEMGLSLRLARLKDDMRQYEERMSQAWTPPPSHTSRPHKILRFEGPCVPPSRTKDPQQLQYGKRLAYMRSSLESKKKEIESVLSTSQSFRPMQTEPIPEELERSSHSSFNHLTDLKDQEIAELRLEQAQLREELARLKTRLDQLENRTSTTGFEEWSEPRPRISFGRGSCDLSRGSMTGVFPQG